MDRAPGRVHRVRPGRVRPRDRRLPDRAADWYVTATDALPPSAGTALLGYAERDPARLAAADIAGFLLLTLGTLLICVGLWRSGAVPRALPVVVAALTLAQFALPPNRALDVGQALLMLSFVGVGALAGRSSR